VPHPSQAPPSPRAPRHVPPPAPPRGATSSCWADTCRTPRRHPFSSRGGVAANYRANGSSNTSSAAAAAATIELGHVRSSYLTSQDALHATGGSHSSGSVLGLHKSFLAEFCSYPSFLGHPQTGGVGSNDCNRHISASLLCLLRPLGKTAWSLAHSCSSVHRRQAPPVHRRQAPPAGHPFTRVPDINTEPTNHTHTHTNTMLAGFSVPGFGTRYRPPLDGRRLQAIQLFGHGPSTHSLCTRTVPGVVLQCSGKSRTLALTVRGACT